MSALWIAFTVSYFAFFYAFRDANEIADASLDGYLEVILLGVPPIVLLGGAMWLRESGIDADFRPRLLGWTVGMGLLFLVTIYTALFIIEPRFEEGERWLVHLVSVGFGASLGTAMGVLELGSKQRQRERDESRRIARRKERERNQLETLNHYLRHEVLNETQKINGFATILEDQWRHGDESARYIETIRQSSDEIATFVKSIRTILDAADYDPDLYAVELMALLEREATTAQRIDELVDVRITGPERVSVTAGDLLNRVVRNLIENAVEHNDPGLRITISVGVEGETANVRIRDDGSGIPPEERADLFEPPVSGDHGYGLFLTYNLVALYDGTLELGETGPDGTEFVVTLPVATTGPEAAEAVAPATRLATGSGVGTPK
jgi:signal transduction histidine kinase